MGDPPLDDLRRRVLEVVAQSPLKSQIADAEVLPAPRDPDDVFVLVRLKLLSKAIDTMAAIELTRGIQEAVTDHSDRVPSVYFDEAA